MNDDVGDVGEVGMDDTISPGELHMYAPHLQKATQAFI